MKTNKYLLILVPLIMLWNGCTLKEPTITESTLSANEELAFSRFMAIGDNITAGYQSAALTEIHQNYSFVAQIAGQTKTPNFQQPLLGYPGLGDESYSGYGILELGFLDDPTTPNTINPDPVLNIIPFSDYPDFDPLAMPFASEDVMLYPMPYSNLAIPGIFVDDILKAKTKLKSRSHSGLIDVILRNPLPDPYGELTPFEQVKLFTPSAIACWVGTYDVLAYAQFNSQGQILSSPTSAEKFAGYYKTLMDSLVATKALVVTANIPDLTEMPYFNIVPGVVMDSVTNTPLLDGNNNMIPLMGVNSGDKLVLSASQAVKLGFGIEAGVYNGNGQPLPDGMVLTVSEIEIVKNTIDDYNTIIDTVCAAREIPVVDMYSFFQQFKNGVTIAGTTFSDKFISGGFYSLDGLHPSDVGNALLANEWIEKINATYSVSIPPVDVLKVMREVQPAP